MLFILVCFVTVIDSFIQELVLRIGIFDVFTLDVQARKKDEKKRVF